MGLMKQQLGMVEQGDACHTKEVKKRNKKPSFWYGVYERKTDRVVAMGSAEECAMSMGIKRKTFYEYASKQQKKYEFYKEAW